MRRVAVTGMGCVSGLGQGIAATWRRLLAGEGAIRATTLPRDGEAAPATNGSAPIGPTTIGPITTGPAAPIAAIDLAAIEARHGRRSTAHLDPLSAFAIVAAIEAIDQAGLADDAVLAQRTGILLGCGSGGNATFEAGYRRLFAPDPRKVHPQTIPTGMISAPASRLAMLLGVHGPAMVIASACASSAHALGEAMHMIRAGRVEVAITGGAEACLTPGSWAGWAALGVMASDTCRPFSRDRQGLVLGEGAAVLVLEDRERAVARGAAILGELTGYGAGSDAAHITAPDQAGIEAAIRAAHADAALPFAEPALVSSHGTGTPLNDATEAAALHAVYGGAIGDHPVIATKSAHGHLIGGSGALEFAIGLHALAEGTAPPILNHSAADPACDLPLVLAPQPIAADHLVSNSFAFGGLNAVLIGRRG